MTVQDEKTGYEGWTILELMGHRRLGGFVREVTLAGAGFLRIDVSADGDQQPSTQFYPPSSVYCMTPVSEAAARLVAKRTRPEPVTYWELPQLEPPRRRLPECAACGERHDPGEPCAVESEVDDDEREDLPV